MIQLLIRYLRGYVKIRVEGYSSERFLNLCSYHRIYIWGLKPCGQAYELYMDLRGVRKIRPIVRKTHTRIHITGRYGFPFFLHRYRKRKLFFLGILLCIGLLYEYSGRIWDIHFGGNESWTDETLMEFLNTKNIRPGMPKKEVDCPQIVTDIRQQYNDIVWVSASVEGSLLKIQIKENEDTFIEEENTAMDEKPDAEQQTDAATETPTDLVASEDGVITDMITRRGVPMVHIGDSVQKGEVLVSGRIEICNDANEVIGYRYEISDADVFADTTMEYTDSVPVTYAQKQYNQKKQRWAAFVQIGSYRIAVGFQKHTFSKWESYCLERRLKLGENFYLPVLYGYSCVKSYDTIEKRYTEKQLQAQLSSNFTRFSKDLKEKGIQIRSNSVKIHLDEDSASASGTLYLNQRIAEPADTEILEIERNELE